jgi:hypothetical protein
MTEDDELTALVTEMRDAKTAQAAIAQEVRALLEVVRDLQERDNAARSRYWQAQGRFEEYVGRGVPDTRKNDPFQNGDFDWMKRLLLSKDQDATLEEEKLPANGVDSATVK